MTQARGRHCQLLNRDDPRSASGQGISTRAESRLPGRGLHSLPSRNKISRMTRTRLNPPLGKYPQPLLYGHVGRLPRRATTRIIVRMSIMFFLPPIESCSQQDDTRSTVLCGQSIERCTGGKKCLYAWTETLTPFGFLVQKCRGKKFGEIRVRTRPQRKCTPFRIGLSCRTQYATWQRCF